MPLQFINIENSQVEFVNPNRDPEKRLEDAEISLGNALLDSAMKEVKINALEAMQGDLLLEVAMLKMGGNL